MRILPIYMNNTNMVFGAFMDKAMPASVNYDLQTVLNDMVTSRIFTQTAGINGVQTLMPNTYPVYQTSPAPAWTTVQGFRGKRVLPKVTLPYSDKFSDLSNTTTSIAATQFQQDAIIATILNHRVSNTGNAVATACIATASGGMMPPVKNADGTFTVAEYDFGAEVQINGLTAILSQGSNIFASTASWATYIQVLVGTVWTDVTPVWTNLSLASTNSEKYYQLPTVVAGRKFRLVSKAATYPLTSTGGFALHFYGDYTSGIAPRTPGKIQHMVVMPFVASTSFAGTVLMSNAYQQWNYGRLFPHYALSVTDDVKLAATTDVLISDAVPALGQDQSVGVITVNFKVINTEAY